jgi:hypothetical protein
VQDSRGLAESWSSLATGGGSLSARAGGNIAKGRLEKRQRKAHPSMTSDGLNLRAGKPSPRHNKGYSFLLCIESCSRSQPLVLAACVLAAELGNVDVMSVRSSAMSA